MKKQKLTPLAKLHSKTKFTVNPALDNITDHGPFIQKKIEAAKEILAKAPLPKELQ
ncbi:MAG TPA: hypothetical protein VNB90_08330 [Cytophagaceae bacterium]|jgi:hypothetical protein|nr:hypothetical protein [Cytophagaceae bacterium]